MTNMRNAILGTVAGLLVGTIGALAYSHYLGDGALLDDLQSKLDAANASLAKAKSETSNLSQETTGVSSQVDQLQASNDELKKELAAAKSGQPATPAPVTPMTVFDMMRGMMRGGQFQSAQRLFLLQTRLKLTPEQTAAIKAAMDADGAARRDLMRQMFRNGGKVDPAAAASANTLDKTLQTVLSPDQLAQYQQVQADEAASRAEITATTQVDQMVPLLQLTDSQKQQALNALYQVQSATPDPNSLLGNPNAMSVLTSQAQATQTALANVLTPAQLALYQQQAQVMPQPGQGGFGRRGGGDNGGGGNGGGTGGGNGGGNGGGGGNAAPAPAPAPAVAPTAAPAATPDATQATTTGSTTGTTTGTTTPPANQ